MPNISSFESKYASTPAGRIHYLVNKGTGKKLVLLHGLAATVRSWTRLVAYLPDEMYICMIDLLGHGDSDAPEIDYTVDLQRKCIDVVIRAEGLSDFYILGHSYGGWLAASYATINKDVRGLIVEDSNGLSAFFDEIVGSVQREQYKKDLLRKALALGAKEHVTKSILADEFSEHMLDEGDLQKIKRPTLILWGENDAVIDPKFGLMFNKYIKGSKLQFIKGAKHTPHYTNPEKVAEYLKEFVDST